MTRKPVFRSSRAAGPEDVTIRFAGSVQEAFAELYTVLSEHPEFREETLERVKNLSEGTSAQHLPTLFAMLTNISVESTAFVD